MRSHSDGTRWVKWPSCLVVLFISNTAAGGAFLPTTTVRTVALTPRHRHWIPADTQGRRIRRLCVRVDNRDHPSDPKHVRATPFRDAPTRHLPRIAATFLLSLALLVTTTLLTNPSASSAEQLQTALADDSPPPPEWSRRYWNIMSNPDLQERSLANEALLDHAVGTITTMYYDNSGGAFFSVKDFYHEWRQLRDEARRQPPSTTTRSSRTEWTTHRTRNHANAPPRIRLDEREGAVDGLKWMVASLHDPFSKYLTNEELRQELKSGSNDGFIGTGAIVEPPNELPWKRTSATAMGGPGTMNYSEWIRPIRVRKCSSCNTNFISNSKAANLPAVTAISPNSPAERAGLIVGDRVVAVGKDKFIGLTQGEVNRILKTRYSAENYAGHVELTIAKPVTVASVANARQQLQDPSTGSRSLGQPVVNVNAVAMREVVAGYRQSKVVLPTISVDPHRVRLDHSAETGEVTGGDAIVQFKLLTSSDSMLISDPSDGAPRKVGYIRLTRFSRASTARMLNAINALETAGAQSYIIDLRNNYGGVVQEAMLTASSLLRDPHTVLCYTMNSRGGFTPHDVEEYILDKRYPGYLLSSEPKSVAMDQVRRETPALFAANGEGWTPPSSFASLHEQGVKRRIKRSGEGSRAADQWNVGLSTTLSPVFRPSDPLRLQKKLVVLINEGTASSAEVFASSLRDNGRTVALVGTKTFGKGLIQHTFPMPDGGGLRLTVAEYLTPSLHHVTNVGSARYDRNTGEWIGGGIRPDVVCESNQGIPSNVGADLCVGMALDALEDSEVQVGEANSLGHGLPNM